MLQWIEPIEFVDSHAFEFVSKIKNYQFTHFARNFLFTNKSYLSLRTLCSHLFTFYFILRKLYVTNNEIFKKEDEIFKKTTRTSFKNNKLTKLTVNFFQWLQIENS